MNAGEALRGRDALESLLRAHDLASHARRLAYEVARYGLRVLPGTGGERSRLGGPPLLPAGESWPSTGTGRALAFLAGVDLSELPDFEERDSWPDDGWLLFFADVELDELHGLYLEEADNVEGERARVLYASPDVEVVAVESPGPGLRSRAVRFVPTLTLPERRDPHLPMQRLELDGAELRRYDSAVAALLAADPRNAFSGRDWPSQHWIGGHAGEYEPDRTVLLNFSQDRDLDFEFMDGGAIRFDVPTDDLVRRDFARVTVTGDPG
ncbi:MAG TPA: YwqG family protein [Conexibacter sp.]|jgi:hypothetical protein